VTNQDTRNKEKGQMQKEQQVQRNYNIICYSTCIYSQQFQVKGTHHIDILAKVPAIVTLGQHHSDLPHLQFCHTGHHSCCLMHITIPKKERGREKIYI
jgi:hypothetical protein